ncbi:MAG: DUF1844 domain-containing protein [Desulfovibrio sp.]|jgi:hypothetical protein|nr:DUF1844 domain-containing protein [Mailhella sp.]
MPGAPTLPKVTFSTFVMSLASSALVHLGEVPNPETGKTERNEELARHTIDVLSMIDEKIRVGLADEESRLLRDVLYELRMKFVARS